jgi:hypothetical protein
VVTGAGGMLGGVMLGATEGDNSGLPIVTCTGAGSGGLVVFCGCGWTGRDLVTVTVLGGATGIITTGASEIGCGDGFVPTGGWLGGVAIGVGSGALAIGCGVATGVGLAVITRVELGVTIGVGIGNGVGLAVAKGVGAIVGAGLGTVTGGVGIGLGSG